MHLLSCKNPKRVYNKYTGEYIWVPCGMCTICKNRRSAHYTSLLERERMQHRYSFFVTLTYSEENIPYISPGDYVERKSWDDVEFVSNRSDDDICIPFSGKDFLKESGN